MSTVKDPVRLVLDPSCPESQRDVLLHGTNMGPPRDAEARVWQALVGAIGVAAVGGAADASTKTTTTTTTATATGLTTAKVITIAVALAALAGLIGLGSYLLSPDKDVRPAVSVATVPVVVEAPPLPDAPPLQPAAAELPPVDEQPRPADLRRRRRATTAQPASRLREETTLLREARQALRQGDNATALRVLDECRRRFPAGTLEQERERLAIEALLKGGRAREASTRAAEFLRKYPDSPHTNEIRGFSKEASGSR
jgi:hypothetical protein